VWSDLASHAQRPLSRLFVQLILIVLAARAMGHLFARAGQPAVMGEMLAGILLGPSFLGWFWPDAFNLVFPDTSLETPRLLSQVGVCLFLFVQGMELDLSRLRERASTAVMVSHISIVFPYFLGVASAFFLFSSLAGPGASFTAFALFMGIAMSVTAFPVLARIINERNLARTQLGTTALTCAAVDDVSAWSILALIVAAVEAGNVASSAMCIAVLLLFVIVMLLGVKPLLAGWVHRHGDDYSGPKNGLMACVLVFVLACSLITQLAGIHALFGSFMAGIVMPRHSKFADYVKVRIENFSSVFLLPLFFAYTGLRTQVGLLHDWNGWMICLGLIGVATLGKLGGSMLAARATGMSWRDSFSLGALMNTRGLMELIALNIGYDMGILSPRIFTMLVLMALVTTFLTGPLLILAKVGTSNAAPSPKPA
jgi:Kef-type K+ transport system membrane component KefB